MRILAVTQRLLALPMQIEILRKCFAADALHEVRADGRVVGRDMGESLRRESFLRGVRERRPALRRGLLTTPQFVEDGGVLRGTGDDGDIAVVLGGGAD